MACKTQLSLPSCFPRVLLSCCHVFGISVTLKLQNELARSRSLHYWCRCCPEWPMVRSLGWGRGWRVEGEGARLCLRGKQGAGQCEGACECGDREFRETPPPSTELCDFLHDAAPVRCQCGVGETGEGMGWRLQISAPVPPTKGQGPQTSTGTGSLSPRLGAVSRNPSLIIHAISGPHPSEGA